MASSAGGVAKGAYRVLYRAVNMGEGADLAANGLFKNIREIETKYFSETLEGAISFAAKASEKFGDVLTVVRTRISTQSIASEMRVSVDSGIPAVVVPTSKLPLLSKPTWVKQ